MIAWRCHQFIQTRPERFFGVDWNTAQLYEAVSQRKPAGLKVEPEILAHTSPLGRAYTLLTGGCR